MASQMTQFFPIRYGRAAFKPGDEPPDSTKIIGEGAIFKGNCEMRQADE